MRRPRTYSKECSEGYLQEELKGKSRMYVERISLDTEDKEELVMQ